MYMNYACGVFILRFKGGRENRQINPSQTLMNLQYLILLVEEILGLLMPS